MQPFSASRPAEWPRKRRTSIVEASIEENKKIKRKTYHKIRLAAVVRVRVTLLRNAGQCFAGDGIVVRARCVHLNRRRLAAIGVGRIYDRDRKRANINNRRWNGRLGPVSG